MAKPEIQVSIREIGSTDPEKVHNAGLKVGGCTNARIAGLGCGGCAAYEIHMGLSFLVSSCAGQTNPAGEIVLPCTTYQASRNAAIVDVLTEERTEVGTNC
jgi:hypothetical protein